MEPGRCAECGADLTYGSCADHFGQLVALDMAQRLPWAAHHTLNVGTYHLQHPSLLRPDQFGLMWTFSLVYLGGGLDEVHAMAAAARRRNHRSVGLAGPGYVPGYAAEPVPDQPRPPARYAVTIADVAVDGSFPAEGYPERMRDWVAATVDVWRAGVRPPTGSGRGKER